MGEVANKYCNRIILTTDNPNFTPFEQINNDIKQGITTTPVTEIFNRKSAIEFGISLFKTNEMLVILGKGAENSNKINGENLPHNDTNSVNNAIEKWFCVKKSYFQL